MKDDIWEAHDFRKKWTPWPTLCKEQKVKYKIDDAADLEISEIIKNA